MKNKISNQNSKFYIKKQNNSFYVSNVESLSTFVYEASGSINFEPYFESRFSWDFESSWIIDGILEKEITISWELGEGELYWYRIETECSKMTCETGSLDDNCNANMTTITTVAARNLVEVCEILNAPTLNPPIDQKITSIKRYSRPVLRSTNNEDCNILVEQEFCQIPECLDYCVDRNVDFNFNLEMEVSVGKMYEHNSSGSFLVTGTSEINGRTWRHYSPINPIVRLGGFALPNLVYSFKSLSDLFYFEGKSNVTSSFYNYDLNLSILIKGQARSESPKRKTYEFVGGFLVAGSSALSTKILFDGNISISGSSYFYVKRTIVPAGSIKIGGIISEFGSAYHSYSFSGSISLNGGFDFNFRDLGTINSRFSFYAQSFDLNLEFDELEYDNSLTISDQTVSVCGCGPVGLFLSASHNLNNSNFISKFLKRNSLDLPENIILRYKTKENSWYGSQYFVRELNQNYIESLSLFFIFSCENSYWKFSFFAKYFNKNNNFELENHTKFIAEIPLDSICINNNISTDLAIRINSGDSFASRGQQIQVVSPDRVFEQNLESVLFYIDDLEKDYLVYYDDIGIFKDSYWNNVPFEIRIEPIAQKEMQTMELSKIF